MEIDVDVRTSGKVIQLERCPRLKNMELRVPGPPEDPDAITVFEVRSQCRRPRGHPEVHRYVVIRTVEQDEP